jgi:hypothetical protein
VLVGVVAEHVGVVMVILFHLLLVCLVILHALLLAIIGAFVALAMIGHATTIITGSAASLQAAALRLTVIAAGMWLAYSIGGGLYDVAFVAVPLLFMVGIVVLAVDFYGRITGNAGGIAGMAELGRPGRWRGGGQRPGWRAVAVVAGADSPRLASSCRSPATARAAPAASASRCNG